MTSHYVRFFIWKTRKRDASLGGLELLTIKKLAPKEERFADKGSDGTTSIQLVDMTNRRILTSKRWRYHI